MTTNAETPRRLSGAFQKSSAVAADAKVPHPSDILRDALKGPHETSTPETDDTAAIRDYWAAAKRHDLRGDFPDYASDDWRALEGDNPRKLAGALMFAEMWRKYGDEIAGDLHQALRTPHELVHRATTEACEAAFRSLARKEAA
jgi:hypothetical protein